jgi:hypothetical protein
VQSHATAAAGDDGKWVALMMRGLRPLFALAAVLVAANVHATEMVEIPTPPPAAPPVCCVVVAAADNSDPQLLVAVDAGPSYRAAFGTSLVGVAAEVLLGGDTPRVSFAGRLHVEFGSTFGLPYEDVGAGMLVMARLSPRIRLGVGFLFGTFLYQRASASRVTDPTVWAPSMAVDGQLTIDILRTRRGGALFVRARVGYDYIDSIKDGAGSSAALAASLGYRY